MLVDTITMYSVSSTLKGIKFTTRGDPLRQTAAIVNVKLYFFISTLFVLLHERLSYIHCVNVVRVES